MGGLFPPSFKKNPKHPGNACLGVGVMPLLAGLGICVGSSAFCRNVLAQEFALVDEQFSAQTSSNFSSRLGGDTLAQAHGRLFGYLSRLPTTFLHAAGEAARVRMASRVHSLCERVDVEYKVLGWGKSPCLDLPWIYDRVSERGHPLVYWEFRSDEAPTDDTPGDETTLFLGGVHPDEVTPVHLAFRFAQALHEDASLYAGRRVIVAPLVNPDGFFAKPYRRTNSNGVDLNRNLPTHDWWASATRLWKSRRNADPRHFPGPAPLTEEGTRFQVDLVAQHTPDKIISVHAPLGFLDYDGPGDTKMEKKLSEYEKEARELANLISRKSNNYRIRDFNFYPGSLGNFSGNERQVPTVTLELESTNPRFVEKYWREFFPGLKAAVQYQFRRNALARSE